MSTVNNAVEGLRFRIKSHELSGRLVDMAEDYEAAANTDEPDGAPVACSADREIEQQRLRELAERCRFLADHVYEHADYMLTLDELETLGFIDSEES